MKQIFLICLCGGAIPLLGAMAVCALEGNPPCLPSKTTSYTSPDSKGEKEKRPMLIISGKGGKIIDIREQGLQDSSADTPSPRPVNAR